MLDNVINYNFPAKPKLFIHRVGKWSLFSLHFFSLFFETNCHLKDNFRCLLIPGCSITDVLLYLLVLGRNSQNKYNGFSIHGVLRSGVEINRLLRTSNITQKWSSKRHSPAIVVGASSMTELLIRQVSSKTKNGVVLRE